MDQLLPVGPAHPAHLRRRLLAVLAALPLVLALLAAHRPRRPGHLKGHDISWPQCPVSAGGYGLPMPPTTTRSSSSG